MARTIDSGRISTALQTRSSLRTPSWNFRKSVSFLQYAIACMGMVAGSLGRPLEGLYLAPTVGVAALRGGEIQGGGRESQDLHLNLRFAGGSAGFDVTKWLALEAAFFRTQTGTLDLRPAHPTPGHGFNAQIDPSGTYSFRFESRRCGICLKRALTDWATGRMRLGIAKNVLEVYHEGYATPSSGPGILLPGNIILMLPDDPRYTRPFPLVTGFGGAGVSMRINRRVSWIFDYDYNPRIAFTSPRGRLTTGAAHVVSTGAAIAF